MCIKGLPNIQLKSHRAIPQDRQPGKASITLKPDQIAVRLTYQEPPYPRKAPVESLKNPCGVDSGVVCTVATSTGIAYTSPNEARLNARIKKAQRQLARKTGAAVRLGLAGYQARLDPYNRQMISDQGRPTFLLVWQEGQPTAAYAKAQAPAPEPVPEAKRPAPPIPPPRHQRPWLQTPSPRDTTSWSPKTFG